jgi:hypothetical protein
VPGARFPLTAGGATTGWHPPPPWTQVKTSLQAPSNDYATGSSRLTGPPRSSRTPQESPSLPCHPSSQVPPRTSGPTTTRSPPSEGPPMTDRHAASPDNPREISCPQRGRCDVRLQREWRVRCHDQGADALSPPSYVLARTSPWMPGESPPVGTGGLSHADVLWRMPHAHAGAVSARRHTCSPSQGGRASQPEWTGPLVGRAARVGAAARHTMPGT